MVGKFIQERGLRDRVVLATKFTFNAEHGNPNAGGNGRKNIYRALEGSLRRLQTGYIDLYWLHAWDRVTPVEEVVSTLNDLVRAGKIRHYGFSDTPAWYVARAQTLAEKDGKDAHRRATARVFAHRAEYRARTYPGGAGTGNRGLPLEPAGGRAAHAASTSGKATAEPARDAWRKPRLIRSSTNSMSATGALWMRSPPLRPSSESQPPKSP